MNSEQLDVRWKQRFSNFRKALKRLSAFIEKVNLSELETQGLIKSFEYTYELAWNTMKDLYEAQGEVGIQGSRDAIRLAFRRGLIEDGEGWMAMIQSRIDTAHCYSEEKAEKVERAILDKYFSLFTLLAEKLSTIEGQH